MVHFARKNYLTNLRYIYFFKHGISPPLFIFLGFSPYLHLDKIGQFPCGKLPKGRNCMCEQTTTQEHINKIIEFRQAIYTKGFGKERDALSEALDAIVLPQVEMEL